MCYQYFFKTQQTTLLVARVNNTMEPSKAFQLILSFRIIHSNFKCGIKEFPNHLGLFEPKHGFASIMQQRSPASLTRSLFEIELSALSPQLIPARRRTASALNERWHFKGINWERWWSAPTATCFQIVSRLCVDSEGGHLLI